MEIYQPLKKLNNPTGDSVKVKLSSYGLGSIVDGLIVIGLFCLVIVSLNCLVVCGLGMMLCLGVLLLSKFKEPMPNDVQNLSV
jgi:hypothetical protein